MKETRLEKGRLSLMLFSLKQLGEGICITQKLNNESKINYEADSSACDGYGL